MTTPLWAPWRLAYVTGKTKKTGCFLCGHASSPADYRENLVLVVQEHAFVALNRFPFTTSHLLVAPRKHVADLTDLDGTEYSAFMNLLRESIVRLRRAVSSSAMNVGFNLGADAGAGVPDHVHGHLVPRWAGDTNFMPVLANVRVMPEYLDDAWRRLYDAFADLPGDRAPDPSTTAGPSIALVDGEAGNEPSDGTER